MSNEHEHLKPNTMPADVFPGVPSKGAPAHPAAVPPPSPPPPADKGAIPPQAPVKK